MDKQEMLAEIKRNIPEVMPDLDQTRIRLQISLRDLGANSILVRLNGAGLHPHPNLEQPLDADRRFAGPQVREVRCRTALSNSHGFGGFDSSLVPRVN